MRLICPSLTTFSCSLFPTISSWLREIANQNYSPDVEKADAAQDSRARVNLVSAAPLEPNSEEDLQQDSLPNTLAQDMDWRDFLFGGIPGPVQPQAAASPSLRAECGDTGDPGSPSSTPATTSAPPGSAVGAVGAGDIRGGGEPLTMTSNKTDGLTRPTLLQDAAVQATVTCKDASVDTTTCDQQTTLPSPGTLQNDNIYLNVLLACALQHREA